MSDKIFNLIMTVVTLIVILIAALSYKSSLNNTLELMEMSRCYSLKVYGIPEADHPTTTQEIFVEQKVECPSEEEIKNAVPLYGQ